MEICKKCIVTALKSKTTTIIQPSDFIFDELIRLGGMRIKIDGSILDKTSNILNLNMMINHLKIYMSIFLVLKIKISISKQKCIFQKLQILIKDNLKIAII